MPRHPIRSLGRGLAPLLLATVLGLVVALLATVLVSQLLSRSHADQAVEGALRRATQLAILGTAVPSLDRQTMRSGFTAQQRRVVDRAVLELRNRHNGFRDLVIHNRSGEVVYATRRHAEATTDEGALAALAGRGSAAHAEDDMHPAGMISAARWACSWCCGWCPFPSRSVSAAVSLHI